MIEVVKRILIYAENHHQILMLLEPEIISSIWCKFIGAAEIVVLLPLSQYIFKI